MHRLFVAIIPPRPVRARLLALMHGVEGARWQSDDQLHLTLRFVGEVDRHGAADIAASLARVRFDPFAAALSGVGTFGNGGRVHTLWAGAVPRDTLTALHHRVDAAIAGAGIAPDRRAFMPHVTLARFARTADPAGILAFVARHAGLASVRFAVTAFALMESSLGSEGASYQLVERYDLA